MNDLGYGVDHTSEGGREYARAASPHGCTIAIGVSETSRVDIQVTGVEETKACEMANDLVEAAEPRVPKG
ncbi:hypothetical protein ACZ91_48680 [Streptomyces regensis]|uniref:Uncharacterized protein n=2 Tax=Prauserella rugosa TaxID=43354 RepID=A0A660CGJ7_9PSEU|nr:hypothetical protein ACZ91_48680 [Streptomyces regensis]TWH21544.1 hypothetical protein JD82_03409 [Prauserella rugosa]